ncbi:MAG TPA: cyclase family protein [Phycisphaerae bacterium]|nr:cyclase family protein [Phycisphaerae bacterium]
MGDWIDVTRLLVDGMTGWPGDPPFRLKPVADTPLSQTSGTSASEAPDALAGHLRVSEICTSAHIGTHVDAPLHCLAGGADVTSIPLDRLCGPAVVAEVNASGPSGEIMVEDLQHVPLQPGDRVLLRTRGSSGCGALSVEAAGWLLERCVVLLGTDRLSPDLPDSDDLPVHRLLLAAGVPIVENLDLDRVSTGRYEMMALPLRIAGAEAAPARVLVRKLSP